MSTFIQDGTGIVVTVADEKDARFSSGWKPYDGTTPAASEAPDKSWKVVDLKAHAEENGIDLGDATKKDDILAAIAAHVPEHDSDDEDEDAENDDSSDED